MKTTNNLTAQREIITPALIEEYGRRLIIESVARLCENGYAELAKGLDGVRVRSSSSLTSTAGIADYAKREVRISAPIHARDGSHTQLRETILHELGHFLAVGFGHGVEWERAVRLIDGTPMVYHSMETGAGLPIVLSRPSSERVCDEVLEDVEQTELNTDDHERLRVLLLSQFTDETRKHLDRRGALRHPQLGPTDIFKVWLDEKREHFNIQVSRPTPLSDKWSAQPLYGAIRSALEAIPGFSTRCDAVMGVQVPATDISAVMLSISVPRRFMRFSGVSGGEEHELSRLTFDFLVKRFVLQAKRAQQASLFKLENIVPPMHKQWLEHSELPLSDYQRAAVLMGMEHDAHALFMDRGTGKTACVVQRICVEAETLHEAEQKMLRVLIVCPNQVRTNWMMEIERFATVSGKVSMIRGSQLDRLEQLVQVIATEPDCKFSAGIVGYDSLVANINEIAKVPWDLVVLDESHYIKSSQTKRWKAVKKLRDRSRMRVVMTGTPIGNTPMDLWAQLEFLGEGLSGFSSFEAFRRFYGQFVMTTGQGKRGVEKLVGIQNAPFLKERLARLSFQITKAEAKLGLPEKTSDIYEIEMTPRQAEVYEQVESQMMAELEGVDLEDPIIIKNVLTKLLRLAQITSGFLGNNVEGQRYLYHLTDEGEVNPKVQAVLDIVTAEDEDPNCKYVVWGIFKEDIRATLEALRGAGVDCEAYYGDTPDAKRDEIARRFNSDSSLRVLVCNPQTAAEGLNLVGYDYWNKTPMCDTYTGRMIFFSSNWSAILRGQAEDRGHRRGTRHHLQITDLIVPGTIDEVIRDRVAGKMAMAEEVLNIRDIMSALRGIGRKSK